MQDLPLYLRAISDHEATISNRHISGYMKLRRRLEKSEKLERFFAWLLAGYIRFCFRWSRWQSAGLEDLVSTLNKGPVILVLWHSRLLLLPGSWPGHAAGLFTLNDPSPIGRIASRSYARLGVQPVHMHGKGSNLSASRKVLAVIRDGHSLGMAVDGPRGPARVANQAALDWARVSGCPVYLFTWSGRPAIRLKSWDRLMIPLPFSRGGYAFRRWTVDIPRKLNKADYARLRQELATQLDALTRELDAQTGAPPDL